MVGEVITHKWNADRGYKMKEKEEDRKQVVGIAWVVLREGFTETVSTD